MKKFLLFATFLASALGMSAQTDVTSKITNADFSSTNGWTAYASQNYKDYGNGLIGTYVVNSNGGAATTDDTHLSTEYCFGFEARWDTNFASYYQEVTLEEGSYTLSYDLENTNTKTSTATSNYTSYCYVSVGDTKYTDDAMEWTSTFNTWTTHSISFTLDTESTVKISLGYYVVVKNVGGGGTPCLYASHLKLVKQAGEVKVAVNDASMMEYEELPTPTATITPEGTTLSDLAYTITHTANGSTCEIDNNAGPGTYAINATATAPDGYSISITAGKLTVNEKTYTDCDNLAFDNEQGVALEHGVCTYDYDTAKNGTTRSGLQTLPGWTPNKTRENGMAGGLFAIGGDTFLGGKGYTAPKAQAEGVEGDNVIGLVAVWGGNDGVDAYYTATKDLDAGTYIVTIPVYNAGGTSELKANYTGITCGDASATATTTKYTVEAWTTETLTLKVTQAGTATIKIGGQYGHYGSDSAPHLFFGPISIEKQTATVVTIDDKEVAYGTTPEYSYTTEDEKTLEGEMTYSLQDSEGNEVTDTPSVGTYTIVGTYSGDEEVKIVNGKLTVTAATVKITVKDDEMTEYGTMPEFSYEVTEGTAPADLTLVATYSKADNSKTPVTYTIEIDETAAPGEYTITAKSEDTNYTLEVTPGTLTVAAKTYDATENLDFSAGDAINIGVTTYDYDTAKNGTTRSGLQSVPCWTPSTAGNNSNGNARAGGLYTAGSDAFIGAKTYKVPESAPEGSNMLLGTMSVWGAEASYTTTKTLAAGVYTLSIPVYNSGNTSSKFTNKIGYKVGEGDAVYATATTYGAEWTTETFTIKVAEESTVTISLGLSYGGGSSNNGAPCLFFGAVTLEEAATESITFTESNKGNDTNVVYVATYVAPYDIDVTALKSNGVTAYELSVTDGKVTYTEIKKDIPEGTPLVVSAGATGTYSVPRATGTTETVTTDLKKGDGSTTVGDGKTIYTLQRGSTSKKLGWYLKKEGDAIAATKCYLEIAEGSSVKDNFIGFDSTATGISGIAADSVKMDGKMYSVSGQQVDENYKGIVIVNGKKYLNK